MNGLWCQPKTKICWKVALVAKSQKCLEIEVSPQSGAPGLDVVWSPLCPDVPITQVSHCTRLSSQVRLGIVQSHLLESGHKSQSCSTSPKTSKRWVAQKFEVLECFSLGWTNTTLTNWNISPRKYEIKRGRVACLIHTKWISLPKSFFN